jgi:hypothetical protein
VSVALSLSLPTATGSLEPYAMREPVAWERPREPIRSRVAFAAAHVVADPLGDNVPGAPAAIDWESTLAARHRLWGWGLGVADAMDTAQRGMGLDWDATQELIRRSAAEARACGGSIACGAGTDHAGGCGTLDDVVTAYEEQLAVVEEAGAQVIVMASRQLAAIATGPDDYAEVYDRVLTQASQPVILHWLGAVFDPALDGYWGSEDLDEAADMVIELIERHAARVDGIKVSVLDPAREVALRGALPAGVRLYTGDDFNYSKLIEGDGETASDALLGAFTPIAPAASCALQALDRGDVAGYRAAMEPTLPLSRHLFCAPTYHYKAGIVFLAWLAGDQPGFTMVAGLQSARSVTHYAEAFRLADAAGLLPDPELAATRMRGLLDVAGVGA